MHQFRDGSAVLPYVDIKLATVNVRGISVDNVITHNVDIFCSEISQAGADRECHALGIVAPKVRHDRGLFTSKEVDRILG